jgi:hypothetical protein
MRFGEFRKKIMHYPFVRSNAIGHFTDKPEILRRQISEWLGKGYLLQLKRGIYTLQDEDRKVQFSRYFIANNLYAPSYISLATGLSFYGLIPEKVVTTTSVTTKKTQTFENRYGQFSYHHIKTVLYGDFVTMDDEFGNKFFIATKERAIIDFLYFNMCYLKVIESDIFEQSFRFQNLDILNKQEIRRIAKKFPQAKMQKLINILIPLL